MKFTSYSFKRLFSPAIQFLVFIGLASSFAGCQWGDEITAFDQNNPDDFMVLFSDTSTVTISTVRYDSVMTGGPDRMLVGRYVDPYLGKMVATAFLQPTAQSSISIPLEAVYDSLELSVQYYRDANKQAYSYGDTTKLMNFSVHALTEDILSKNVYYNVDKTPFDSIPIGSISFYPRPFSNGTLHIKLSDALGANIFTQAKANLITSNERWIEILKGVMITSKPTDNGSVIGFQHVSDSTAIQLHYHTTGLDGITKGVVTFKNTAAYNQILGDRSKTSLAALPNNRRNALPSALSGEKSFIQEGVGIMTRVDFPNIRSLKDTKYSVSNRGFLRITPIKQSITHFFPAPPQLHVFLCDKNNAFLGQLTNLQGSSAIVGSYVNDLINNTEYYSFDVSGYITQILNSTAIENPGLMLVTSALSLSSQYPEANLELSKGVRRLVIGSQKNTSDRGVKLELYYTTVKAQTK